MPAQLAAVTADFLLLFQSHESLDSAMHDFPLAFETSEPRGAAHQDIIKLHRKAGVTRDTTHRERVDRVVARDGHDALTITHDDMLPLSHDAKSGLFQCSHGV